jgi:hypothetical protein
MSCGQISSGHNMNRSSAVSRSIDITPASALAWHGVRRKGLPTCLQGSIGPLSCDRRYVRQRVTGGDVGDPQDKNCEAMTQKLLQAAPPWWLSFRDEIKLCRDITMDDLSWASPHEPNGKIAGTVSVCDKTNSRTLPLISPTRISDTRTHRYVSLT